jgi:tetratricopeptide (TPR) repeat protein
MRRLRWLIFLTLGLGMASAVMWAIAREGFRQTRQLTAAEHCFRAWGAIGRSDHDTARRHIQAGLGFARRTGDVVTEISLLSGQVTVLEAEGKYQEAGATLERMLILNRRVPGRDEYQALWLSQLAVDYEHYRPAAESEALYLRALSIAEAPGMTNTNVKRGVLLRYWSFLSGRGRTEEAAALRDRIKSQWPGAIVEETR